MFLRRLGIERHQLQVKSLKSAAAKRQSTLNVVEQRVQQLRGQLAAAERMELATAQQVEHFNGQVGRTGERLSIRAPIQYKDVLPV